MWHSSSWNYAIDNLLLKNMSKKILIFNNGFRIGGIEMASVSFANYCASKGYDVTVAALYESEREVAVNDSVNIIEPDFNKSKYKVVNIIRTFQYIRGIVRRLNPDVIVAHGEWTNGFVVFSLMGMRQRLYLQDHMNPDIIPKLGTAHTIINRLFYRRAKGIIALSNYSKEMMMKYYHVDNIAVIPNPVREIVIDESFEGNHVVTIGRVSKEKGHIYLVKAWKKLLPEGWTLDIVGDGPEMEQLKQEAEGVGSIVFHGFQKEIAKYLSEASVFVLPSLSECFPLALIEAMSVGKACVATDCMSGKDTIVENGKNGLLIEPGNVDEMADAIQTLISDHKLRTQLGGAARKIKEDLSADKLYKEYLDFIRV